MKPIEGKQNLNQLSKKRKGRKMDYLNFKNIQRVLSITLEILLKREEFN